MSSTRRVIAVASLVTAAFLGCLYLAARPSADATKVGPLAGGPALSSSHTALPSHPYRPARRQKTRPDPTPEDQSQTTVADRSDEDPTPVVAVPADRRVADWLLSSPTLSWSEPSRFALLFQLTCRIRC
jgi:hypothetical protein